MAAATADGGGGIAVIGMAGRLPKAPDLATFWRNLRDGIEGVTFFSDADLIAAGVDRDLLADSSYVKAGAMIEDVDLFDAAFFGINPREAELMDPQQRLFLEHAWLALEDAAVDSERFAGRIGVFGSTGSNSYFLNNLMPNAELLQLVGEFQAGLLNEKDFLSTRVAYKLNLTGPSLTVQSACSSSLVAVHMACQSLLAGECDMALAGGVAVRVPQVAGYLYREGGIASPDGHCRAFDARARGTVYGNGVGVVALKPVDRAIADGDRIYAVIKGSAVNNDGSAKVGYTAPGMEGQAEVIAEAMAVAGFHPDSMSYVEAHGTGTPLGDPIEVAALTRAYGVHTKRRGYCAIGSVKTNIGHLDAAAGVAGLIKTVLSLHHRQLPPSLHYTEPNPQIDFTQTPFRVNDCLTPWETGGAPRRAGVSAFGMGGTNAHVVLEEAPMTSGTAESRSRHLLPISARSREALDQAVSRLARYLQEAPDRDLAQVAATLQLGRRQMPYRLPVVAGGAAEVAAAAVHRGPVHRVPELTPGVTFLFPGQGAQHIGMAQGVYTQEQAFRTNFDRCVELLAPYLDLDLRVLLFAEGGDRVAREERLRHTAVAQPALFAVEYALAQQWMAWGVRPRAMAGHSVGEYVAACLAGVFSLEDALALVAARGRLMGAVPPGAMLAVPLPESEVQGMLVEGLSLAAVNAPDRCVLAGPEASVRRAEDQLAARGVEGQRLRTSHAFHSDMLVPVMDEFARAVHRVTLSPPRIPFVSNLTGRWITEGEATDPKYWVQHMRRTVRLADGLGLLLGDRQECLLEVGPGRTLVRLLRRHPAYGGQTAVASLPGAGDGAEELLMALGELWAAGVEVEWPALYAGRPIPRRTSLPPYPFERHSFWVDAAGSRAARTGGAKRPSTMVRGGPAGDLDDLTRKEDESDWYYVPSWRRGAALGAGSGVSARGVWVVFTDACGLGDALIERIRSRGGEVVRVVPGEGFARLLDGTFSVRPTAVEDHEALWRQLAGRALRHVLHLWTVTGAPVRRIQKTDQGEFANLLCLMQSLGSALLDSDLSVCVVSDHTQRIIGDETILPSRAMVIGPCLSAPQEIERVHCRHVDVRLGAGHAARTDLAERLWREALSAQPEGPVAYRGTHRWVQCFEPVRVPPAQPDNLPLRADGVYLITGGLGGVGMALATRLASQVRARLVLVGRSPFPDRREWEDWSQHGYDAVGRRIAQIMEMERMGAAVRVVQADVTNAAAMRRAVRDAAAVFGTIHGVIHAAGVAGGGMIQHKTLSQAEQVMAAKVRGTKVLHEVFRRRQLDFMLLCSSLRSMVGKFGQSDYSAANLFLDAFATSADRPRRRVVVVNWPTWSEAGMAVDALGGGSPEWGGQVQSEMREAGISNLQGGEAFCRVMTTGLSQVVVSPQDPNVLRRASNAATATALSARMVEAKTARGSHPRPQLGTSYSPPSSATEEQIAGVWQDLLGIDAVGVHDNFFELGGDSLVALQAVSALHKRGINLTSKQMFEHPTVAELAAFYGAGGESPAAEQGPVEGPVPLTPVQRWFVSQDLPAPNYWNQAMLLEVAADLDAKALEQSLGLLVQHHDALRLRLRRSGADWLQENAGPLDEPGDILRRVDLSTVPPADRERAIVEVAQEAHGKINLADGPLLRAVHLDLGSKESGRLLLAVHHWSVEAVSWQILLEDLAEIYGQVKASAPPVLPQKTASFRQWAEALAARAADPDVRRQAEYWLDPQHAGVAPLPLDMPEGRNSEESARVVPFTLEADRTSALLQEVPSAYRTQLSEVLLAALTRALRRWTGRSLHLVDIEGHGRDALLELDVSRTVGWFTAVYPILLRDPGGGPGELLKRVKESMRSVPDRGVGYGLLRYASGDADLMRRLAELPQAEISFTLLGQQTAAEGRAQGFGRARERTGPSRHPDGLRRYLLDVDVSVLDGRLVGHVTHSAHVHARDRVEALTGEFHTALEEIIDHCLSQQAGGYTPSDFPEVGLDQAALDSVLDELTRLSD